MDLGTEPSSALGVASGLECISIAQASACGNHMEALMTNKRADAWQSHGQSPRHVRSLAGEGGLSRAVTPDTAVILACTGRCVLPSPYDCDCVRSGDLLLEILDCPTVRIRADTSVVRGTMLYGTLQNILARQVKSRNRCRPRPCMSCEVQWKAARAVRAASAWQLLAKPWAGPELH